MPLLKWHENKDNGKSGGNENDFIILSFLHFSLVGFFNGFFTKEFLPEDVKLPVILIVASDLIANIFVYLTIFLFRGDFNFYYYFMNLIVPEIVYTLLVTIVLYFIILKVNKKLEEYEKRSASKFG